MLYLTRENGQILDFYKLDDSNNERYLISYKFNYSKDGVWSVEPVQDVTGSDFSSTYPEHYFSFDIFPIKRSRRPKIEVKLKLADYIEVIRRENLEEVGVSSWEFGRKRK